MTAIQIIIPASTSNLGASFDACGVALSLYLKVTVEEQLAGFQIALSGEGADRLPRDESNLILRVARSVAELRGGTIKGMSLFVDNQIPLARGLGSSSAAIIAGISVYETLTDDRLTEEEVFGCENGGPRWDWLPKVPELSAAEGMIDDEALADPPLSPEEPESAQGG